MSEWLSEEWVLDSASAIELDAAVNGQIQVTVTGGPRGEVRYHRTYSDGRAVASGFGPLDDPAVALILPLAEALDVLEGRLDPSVAFMQGRLKTAGDNGLLLELLAGWSSPAGVASLRRLRSGAAR